MSPVPLSALPSVRWFLDQPALQAFPRALARDAVRAELELLRGELREGRELPPRPELLQRVLQRARALHAPRLRRVLNATGVVLHTNLGRAPLGERVARVLADTARGYAAVEYDFESGGRGDRLEVVRDLLRLLTGAEDAVVVNNNAAAVLLALSALARGREVILSRGQVVEIGGSFRVHEVAQAGGARLVEVGTTNRTHLRDYEAAIGPETAGILAVHPSNFRVLGFTTSVPRAELARLAHARGLWFYEDLGSGSLLPGFPGEPTVAEVVRAGVDAVSFSGDKLLGGPQAGIVVGRRELLRELARHPLYRALRLDKLVLAALEAALRLHLAGEHAALPAIAMLRAPTEELEARARALARALEPLLRERGFTVSCEPVEGRAGAGALPERPLPSWAAVLRGPGIEELVTALRHGEPPVVGRLYRSALYLDPRTLLPGEEQELVEALRAALSTRSARTDP